jgi:hypothetical protein
VFKSISMKTLDKSESILNELLIPKEYTTHPLKWDAIAPANNSWTASGLNKKTQAAVFGNLSSLNLIRNQLNYN